MNKYYFNLHSIGSKIAFGIGLLASATAIIAFDFSPPIPTTDVSLMHLAAPDAVEDGLIREFIEQNHPDLIRSTPLTSEEWRKLNLPENLKASQLEVSNYGNREIEDLTVSFSFYHNQEAVYSDGFAGELTLGPNRHKSAVVNEPSTFKANFVEVCLTFDGALLFERITERYLIPINDKLLIVHGSKIEYDRKRRFMKPANCHQPPNQASVDMKY